MAGSMMGWGARQKLATACHHLYATGLVVGSGGNVSVRTGGQVLVTPTGGNLGEIAPEELVLLELDGSLRSQGKPTSEWQIHCFIYQRRPDVNAIVHVHPLHATAIACLPGLDETKAMPAYTPGYGLRVGDLPLVPFFSPSTTELAKACVSALAGHNACLMANHGIVTVGGDLAEATNTAEEVEYNARLHLLLGGKGIALTPEQVVQVRRYYGVVK